MKRYIKPETSVHRVMCESQLLTGTGVQSGDPVQEVYREEDVSYSRSSVWDDAEE